MPSTQVSSAGGLEWGSHQDFSSVFSRLMVGHSNKPSVTAIASLGGLCGCFSVTMTTEESFIRAQGWGFSESLAPLLSGPW